MEPVCAQTFHGNTIDASSYRDFVRDNQITNGVLITDKDFPPSQLEELLSTHPDLHYLTPLKRNDKKILENEMLADFSEVIDGIEKSSR